MSRSLTERAFLGLSLGAAVLSGCSKAPPPSQFPNAQAALDRMQATYACARGVQGDGKLDHMNEAGRFRGDIMLLASDPARVRFDVISPFGVVLATLTSDGHRFSMFDMKNKVFLEGPPEPCNIARLTQVRMPAHALVRLMRGEAPLLVHAPDAASIAWDGAGYYVVTIPSLHEAVEVVHLVPSPHDFDLPYMQQRLRVLRVVVTQRDYVHFDTALMDHEVATTMPAREDDLGLDPPIPPSGPACSAEVPRRIRVRVPYTSADVLFRYKETGLNPPLPEGVFTQAVPGGVQRRWVTCR